MAANTTGGQASDHRRLVRGELTTKEYVDRLKADVNRRLGISPSRLGRAGRRQARASSS